MGDKGWKRIIVYKTARTVQKTLIKVPIDKVQWMQILTVIVMQQTQTVMLNKPSKKDDLFVFFIL